MCYSTSGFSKWVKQELKSYFIDISDQVEPDEIMELLCIFSDISVEDFVKIFTIRSPYTNLPYNRQITYEIYHIFIKQYGDKSDILFFMNS